MTSELLSLSMCVVDLLHAAQPAGFRIKKFGALPK
jgi:hypothetical protein